MGSTSESGHNNTFVGFNFKEHKIISRITKKYMRT